MIFLVQPYMNCPYNSHMYSGFNYDYLPDPVQPLVS